MSDAPGVTVWGAGSVGLTLAARLAHAGTRVQLVCRTPEAARLIADTGVTYRDLASGESFVSRVETAGADDAACLRIGDGPVLLCVRSSDTERAAVPLLAVAPRCVVVCVQNGVDAEDALASNFSTVVGAVYRQTCTRGAPNDVVSAGGGRIVLGVHPEGSDVRVAALGDALRVAGYDVGVSERIVEDKWLKLVVNLMSAPNALIRRADHTTEAFVALKVRLLEEARDALAAAGVVARSCDGRDRSIDEEIEFQRGALSRGTSARDLPLYNQVWSSLKRGAPLEADGYHRRVLDLAQRHGVGAPMNSAVLATLEDVARHGRGPESVAATDLLSLG